MASSTVSPRTNTAAESPSADSVMPPLFSAAIRAAKENWVYRRLRTRLISLPARGFQQPKIGPEWVEVSVRCIDLVGAMKRLLAPLLLGLSLPFAACEKAEISSYRVSKSPSPQVMAAQADNSRPAPAPAPKSAAPAA